KKSLQLLTKGMRSFSSSAVRSGALSNVFQKQMAMKVSLTDAGKRYNRDWIFRHFNYKFETGQSYAITGPNGSGKSTLLQALSGSMMLNEGSIQFGVGGREPGIS